MRDLTIVSGARSSLSRQCIRSRTHIRSSLRISSLLIDVSRIRSILICLLKEIRLHRTLLISALAVLIHKRIGHVALLGAVTLMSVAQARNAAQVCLREPDLSPVLADGRSVPCRDFELFYTLIQLGRTADALKLTDGPIGGTK